MAPSSDLHEPVAPSWSEALLARVTPLGKQGATAVALLVGVLALLGLAVGPVLRLSGSAVAIDVQVAEDVELSPLETPSAILAADGSELGRVDADVNREPVTTGDLPQHVMEAVIAAEDRGFREHRGYDIGDLMRALPDALRANASVPHGSTITQQVARENFLDGQRTLRRRIEELAYAVALEQSLDKGEILERYLNEAYFGSGAHGIQAAAQEFFDRDASDLRVEQAALLAGLLQAPSALDPRENPHAAELRRDSVLAAMADERYLSDDRAEDLVGRPPEIADATADEEAEPSVAAAVRRELLANPALGATEEERAALLGSGGLTVRTTIDADAQEAAREVIDAAVEDEGITGALVALDPRDGSVRALHAGEGIQATGAEHIGQLRRQPGSAFEPFVLVAALEGVGVEQAAEELNAALANGDDAAFAQHAGEVEPSAVADLSARLGINAEEAMGPDPGAETVSGDLDGGVTPVEMAAAYGTLAQRGQHVAPALVERVEERDGRTRYTASREGEPQVSPRAATLTISALQRAARDGTDADEQLPGWEPAGRAGTAPDYADAWFAGSVPGLSAVVWLGRPEGRAALPEAVAGGMPAPLWTAFMATALEDREPVDFALPADAGETEAAEG